MESPLRQQADALGAVWGEVAGRSVPRHFGNGAAEYRAVRESVGIAHRSDQAQIRVWGRDPVKMVQGLITNDLAGAPPNQGVYAAMLTPKGRTIAELRAFRRGAAGGVEVLLDLPREAVEGTREHLKKFVPPLFARWADVSEEHGCIGVYGPRARELTGRVLGTEVPELAEDGFVDSSFGSEPLLVVRTLYAGLEEGYDLFAAAPALPALWDALLAQGADLDVRPVGFGALETLRVEAGRPRYGYDLTEEVIPTEAFEASGLLPRAISFTKGCYTGQEVIVRIAHRGHVNRHLRGLLLGDAPTPVPRTPLHHPETGKQIGWTASAAVSPLLGQTIALGYVRREIAPGGNVRVGSAEGAEATVAALPFEEARRPG
ncbi:MAG: aminomethyltransferase family protein [Gemmatimonadota bacterium]|nr:aminomethyltransferase family protein [Gemmatimonadota bacterium]